MPKRKKRTQLQRSYQIKTYSELRSRVRSAIREGRNRVEKAVEREKVRTSWEIGKLILEHVLLNEPRAGYGQKVIKRLSSDLNVSIRQIRYFVEFAREYPIRPPAAELSWSHYRVLLAVNNLKVRNQIARKAERFDWTRDELRAEVKRIKAAELAASAVKSVKREAKNFRAQGKPVKGLLAEHGIPGAVQVIREKEGPNQGKLVYDLGFSNYYRPAEGIRGRNNPPNKKDLHTYEAFITKVIDGDTLWARIKLGFGFSTKQKLRLRGIDTPEVISKKGRLAKNYLSRQLKNSKTVLIKTKKSDKFDRYLADVWVDGIYINQLLLIKGYARRV